MKLLSVAVPCFNSQNYMAKAIESLLPGGDGVEILIVDDGSNDNTAEIADRYALQHPRTVRVIHKENGGHGDAVMTGLRNARGLYFKVVDSDDWVDGGAYSAVLKTLSRFSEPDTALDMLVSNYTYDKAGSSRKHIQRYARALPGKRVFGWDEVGRFRKGQYMLMHSVIYRTQLLRDCGLDLPKHTFYVDNLYAYLPLVYAERMFYLDEDFYRYFIGRDDQSVNESVMINRIDQALLVNKLMITKIDLNAVKNKNKRAYMLSYLEIVTTVSSVLLIKSGTEENLAKMRELWDFMRDKNPSVYKTLKRRFLGRMVHLPGRPGRAVLIGCYKLSQKIFGFN